MSSQSTRLCLLCYIATSHYPSILHMIVYIWASQVVPVVKNPPANAGEACLIPGLGGSLGVGSDNPLQYSCLGNPWTVEPGGLQSGVG